MKALGAALVLALLVSCATPAHHVPPPAPLLRLGLGVYGPEGGLAGALVSIIDGPSTGITGVTNLKGEVILTGLHPGLVTVCVVASGFLTDGSNCGTVTLLADRSLQLTLEPTPTPKPQAPVIHADGRIFRTADGKPWRWKGVSAFALFDRITRGEDVRDTLDAYKGYNVLRVWPYVPRKDWGAKAWDVTYTAADAKQYLAALAALGWTVELTLLTDDDPGRLAWASQFVRDLATAPRPSNLLLEIGNEPETHKHINTAVLRDVLQASGFVYASGNYEDSSKAFGGYLVAHTQRDSEWPRRAHDCLDYYAGGGPNAPSDPAHRTPCVLDEPAKAQDVAPNANDWRAYLGAASLMAAGATFHSETGKFGLPPTPAEAVLAAAALEGLNAFPADAPLLPYGRPVEQSLRTYTAGDRYMVRVRPTTPTPGAGWSRLGTSAVFWRR